MRCLLFLLALSACAPDTPAPPDVATVPASVDATGAWRLVALDGVALADGLHATATFSQGRLSGSGGCNDYSTGYAVDGDRFRLADDVIWTLQLCLDAADELEAAFSEQLALARRIQLDGGRLALLDSLGAERLGFVRG